MALSISHQSAVTKEKDVFGTAETMIRLITKHRPVVAIQTTTGTNPGWEWSRWSDRTMTRHQELGEFSIFVREWLRVSRGETTRRRSKNPRRVPPCSGAGHDKA